MLWSPWLGTARDWLAREEPDLCRYFERHLESVLLAVAGWPAAVVRSVLAADPDTPTAVRIQMADDAEYGVREMVARSPETPVAILRRLGRDPHRFVRMCRRRVKTDPQAPVEF